MAKTKNKLKTSLAMFFETNTDNIFVNDFFVVQISLWRINNFGKLQYTLE